jgi:hypothetical protein
MKKRYTDREVPMDDTKAIEALTAEMALTRSEMAALTDALRAKAIRAQELTAATNRLTATIQAGLERRGFWQRLAG